jgi:hypothetical protein
MPSGMEKMGPVTQKLYDTLTGIQMGDSKPEGLDSSNRVSDLARPSSPASLKGGGFM